MRWLRIMFMVLCLFWIAPVLIPDAQPAEAGFVEVQAEAATAQIYVGQPVIYSARIYTNSEVNDANFMPPDFSGLGQSSLPPQSDTTRELLSGIDYNLTTQRYMLYPLRAGTVTIAPYRVQMPQTPFYEATTLESETITLDILPLPDNPPPAFKNAVGQYDMTATVQPGLVQFGEPVTLTVTLRGSGNIEQVLPPDVPLPAGWRVTRQTPEYRQDTLRFGTKVFRWSIIPDRGGVLDIPLLTLSFFNPESQLYESRRTPPLVFIVEGAPQVSPTLIPSRTSIPSITPLVNALTQNAANALATDTAAAPTQTAATELPSELVETSIAKASLPEQTNDSTSIERNEINRIVPELKVIPDDAPDPLPPFWFWVLWLIPPLMIVLAFLPRAYQVTAINAAPMQRGSAPLRTAADQLKAARRQIDAREAYRLVANTIYDYLSEKADQRVTANNFEAAIEHLPAAARNMLIACHREARTGQYAPVTDHDAAVLISRTRQALREADRSWR